MKDFGRTFEGPMILDLSSGGYVDVRAFGSDFTEVPILAAVSAIGALNRTLYIPCGSWVISDNITISANINLKIENGGLLLPIAGKTVTVNGTIEAGPYPIFGGDGTVNLTNPDIYIWDPWWMGHLTGLYVTNNLTLLSMGASGAGYVKNNGAGLLLGGQTILADELPTGIDAAKLADGSVSNAEFEQLDGISGNIQALLDSKAPSAGINAVAIADGSVTNVMFERLTGLPANAQTLITNNTNAIAAIHDNIVKIANYLTTSFIPYSTTSGHTIPWDDSIPQYSEGYEFLTLTMTPASSANYLMVEVVINLGSPGSDWSIAALFRDYGTPSAYPNAVATYFGYHTYNWQVTLRYVVLAGNTNATTFRVRAGGNSVGFSMNGYYNARYLGGTMASSITVTEIKP